MLESLTVAIVHTTKTVCPVSSSTGISQYILWGLLIGQLSVFPSLAARATLPCHHLTAKLEVSSHDGGWLGEANSYPYR